VFPAYLFHELLHPYVYDLLPFEAASPLKEKYRDEKPLVLAHLHVMAIQKAVYTGLGRPEVLALLYDVDSRFMPEYQRSWDIVEKEGAEAFVRELRR
jgi:hypothetical protein